MNKSQLIFILLWTAIIISFILKFYVLQQSYRITLNGEEVNNLTACCLDISSINYFDNNSYYNEISGMTNLKSLDNIEDICITEESSIYYDITCKEINNKHIDSEWLDLNAECIKTTCPNGKGICEWTTKGDQIEHCSQYKFGDYTLNLK